MQNINYVTLILIIVLAYPLLIGLILGFSSNNVKKDINSLEDSIISVISLLLGVWIAKIVLVSYKADINKFIRSNFPEDFKGIFLNNQIILYITLMIICSLLLKVLLSLIVGILNHISIYMFLDVLEGFVQNSGGVKKRLLGIIVKIPRAIFNVIIASIVLYIVSYFSVDAKLNKSLQKSEPYKYVCENVIVPFTNSDIAKSLPDILNDSMKIVIKTADGNEIEPDEKLSNNALVYYNGVTLTEGVKSNEEIDKLAKDIVKSAPSSKQKARLLYNWIGNNIKYDKLKAELVGENDFSLDSGAIPTYKSRKGICFDYSCLFVAMCRANNFKVRLITGKGFNGSSWVNHAWNMVYINEEKKWINVDTTFHNYGDYFDSEEFSNDHSDSKIAGEW